MDTPSLDGRWFHALDEPPAGEPGALPGPATVFRYTEQDGEVWGVYTGGPIRRGYLVGSRDGDVVRLRYVQTDQAGDTASGCCEAVLRVHPDGRLRLAETWRWESMPGSGTRVLAELPES